MLPSGRYFFHKPNTSLTSSQASSEGKYKYKTRHVMDGLATQVDLTEAYFGIVLTGS